MPDYLLLVLLCSVFAGSASALRVPLLRRDAPHSTTLNFSSKPATDGGGNFDFTNHDIYYSGTIFLNGQPFIVDLDTGSSDLWLDTSGVSLNGFTNTSVPGFIRYGDGTTAGGPILLGNVTFGDFVIEQAFVSAPGSNAVHPGDKGLLGLGPPNLSTVAHDLQNTIHNGNSLLDNIFSTYPLEPNFMTFSLSRSDAGTTNGGVFTIGEIPDQFSALNNTSPYEVVPVASENFSFWAINLEAVIIGGQRYTGHGSFGSGDVNIAILDTGTTLALAPPFYVDAMYKSIDGASIDPGSSRYLVPCDAKVDISFIFGNVTFPINPIDATLPYALEGDTTLCAGAFSYNTGEGQLDFLLGDIFLRNVVSLYDFGNSTTIGESAPFVKLLSVTNSTQADAGFDSANKARLAAFANTYGSASRTRRLRNIIIGAVCGGVALIAGIIALVMRRKRSYRQIPNAPGGIMDYPQPTSYEMPYNSNRY